MIEVEPKGSLYNRNHQLHCKETDSTHKKNIGVYDDIPLSMNIGSIGMLVHSHRNFRN